MHVNPVDLAAVVIGSLFVTIGAVSVAVAFSARPRANRSATWFGVFFALYGLRLLAGSELVQAVTTWPERVFQYLDASITYAILVPATLFVESLIGPGRHTLLRRTWQMLAIGAAGGILADLVARRPYAAVVLNKALVVIAIGVWFLHLAAGARRGRWSVEVRGVMVAGSILALTAIWETISDRGLLGAVDAEPLAMLLFAGALGWFVLARAREQEFRYAALSRELELARSIQQSLLPQRMPDIPGLRLAGVYLPMSAVAGDLYEILTLSDRRPLVLVADVSGHGIPAALIASMVKVAVAAEADRHQRPGDVLTGINRALTGKFDRAYVTACCVVVDPERRTLMYAAAGHPPPLLRRAGGSIVRLDRGGTVLTMLPDVSYDTMEVPFEPGDRLLLYTDGLTEARRAHGEEFFGDAELGRVVSATPPADDLMRAVLDAHSRWIGEGTPLSDDISVVVIDNVEQAAPSAV